MNIPIRRLGVSALGFLMVMVLSACLVPGGGGYVGGGYEEPGYEYGGWRSDYHVGPPRGGERRPEQQSSPHAYQRAAPSRSTPSIPTRPHPHSH
jgi:hypothetical protein